MVLQNTDDLLLMKDDKVLLKYKLFAFDIADFKLLLSVDNTEALIGLGCLWRHLMRRIKCIYNLTCVPRVLGIVLYTLGWNVISDTLTDNCIKMVH